ncbi:hypothetical protein EDD99_7144 [Streptomyces sp. 846.5]|nr:hypothetical protein [Streptomyces sp. 846.5]TDT95319.1 hypothetical protein EDD99_7144 [Streptomyces sp. 846.5]
MTTTAFEAWCAVGVVTLLTSSGLQLHPRDHIRALHRLDWIIGVWLFTGLLSLGLGGQL